MKKNKKNSKLFGGKKGNTPSAASTVITDLIKLTELIPAYFPLKYASTCCACKKKLKVGTNAFYFRDLKRCVCFACGIPEWKSPRTPYGIRRQIAMEYKENDELLKAVVDFVDKKKENIRKT
jgi:hypothetical protein